MKKQWRNLGERFAAVSDALQPAVAALGRGGSQGRGPADRAAEPSPEVLHLIDPRVARARAT